MSADSESVIEFGAPDEDDRPRRLPFLRDLGGDHRLPALVAGLGAVAAFASMISEWQTTTVQNVFFEDGEPAQVETFPTDLMDLGGIGAAYLVGLVLLVTGVVLTLFGPEPGRRYARLAGFSVGGVLLAVLLAVVHMLGAESVLISRIASVGLGPEQQPDFAYGRGIWCALAAVTAALVALWLVDRRANTAPRQARPVEDVVPDTPLELSIAPAEPFAQFPGDRDQPHRS
ncbi:hypothetical protein [Actinoplanes sp. DH11]|uniref:hypothetical protein n=1 Tax=Actinoplanes sp. DH11 TaxID=2857011 RepID=UPI001E38252D|nr:hypothetical protein [Actinoplanes sp. DH11]